METYKSIKELWNSYGKSMTTESSFSVGNIGLMEKLHDWPKTLGGDLVPAMPRCVRLIVKEMGPFSGFKGVK